MATETDHSTDISNGADAEAFVESVMSTQLVFRVDTPAANTSVSSRRKRSVSEVDPTDPVEDLDSTVKKARVTARRVLYGDAPSTAPTPVPTAAPRRSVVAQADVHVDGDPSIEHLIHKLSSDMHMLFSSLTERMNNLESSLEQRISNKVAQLLDKRVSTELGRIRREVDNQLDSFKESLRSDVTDELEDVQAKIQSMSNGASSSGQADITRNVVIRGLPETPSEVITTKVNNLFKNGLKVPDVTCCSADRKPSSDSSKPGVVIVTMKSHDDKRKVMTKKANLKSHQQYSSVFIHHDQTQAERVMSSNFRTILSALNHRGLSVRGSRVIRVNPDSRQSRPSVNNSAGSSQSSAANYPSDPSSVNSASDSRVPNDYMWQQRRNYRGGNRGGNGGGNRGNGQRGRNTNRDSNRGAGNRGRNNY